MKSSRATGKISKDKTNPGSFFARGAEAKISETSLLGMPVLIKERTEKEYRAASLDEQIRRARTKNEARVILRAKAAGINVPRIFSVGNFSIYLEKIKGKRLREDKAVPHKSWVEIGRMLAKMHDAGITHGDFTPANIILSKDGIYVIDFGLAKISEELEERAVDVLLMEKNISKAEFSKFMEGYKRLKSWKQVLGRVDEIRKRGRYQIRTGEIENGDDES